MIYNIVHGVMYLLLRFAAAILGRLRRTGVGNVPKSGPIIYCPNHVSDSDPAIMLVSIPRRAWFVGKEELFNIPIASTLFRLLHGVAIKRDSADRAALRRLEAILARGECLVLFPEGRCAQDGKLQRIQPGAALLAQRTGAKIVPVALTNTAKLLPYGSVVPRFTAAPVAIEFGTPIDPAEFEDLPKNKRVDAMTDRLARDIATLVHQSPPIGV